jgi:hypothetical protein
VIRGNIGPLREGTAVKFTSAPGAPGGGSPKAAP